MDSTKTLDDDKLGKPPSPLHFDIFMPWAFKQLQTDLSNKSAGRNLNMRKIVQTDYVSVAGHSERFKTKAKSKMSRIDPAVDFSLDDRDFGAKPFETQHSSDIQVTAVYDNAEHLVQLQFQNNIAIPRLIFQIIRLIIQYHEYLNTIAINRGVDEYTLHEISKFLPYSNITDISLDNTFLKEGNYYVLLEMKSTLRHLSLRRCSINDDAAEAIANTLVYPNNGSRALSILNLASNRITDEGAKYFAQALRSNRQLSYLNLSDNSITDIGAGLILDSLKRFPLSSAELLAFRSRMMTYLRKKNEHVISIVKNLRAGDFDKRVSKRKSLKQSAKPMKGVEKESSFRSLQASRSLTNFNQVLNEKAISMAENILGIFSDPFDKNNTVSSDDIVYCHGNNTLCYLNLGYNNLTFVSLTKLISTLKYQRELGRKPKGLINVIIEGNYMPKKCKELDIMENIIEVGLITQNRRLSLGKKKSPAKSGGR